MITVRNETEFKDAIATLEPDIQVENDISLTSQTTINYAVSIKGAPGVSLFWASPSAARPNMFIIGAAGDVTIESLILDAQGRDGTLVQINGGRFTMNEDTILRNVTGRTSQNAVAVGDMTTSDGGTFIMNHGLITGISSADAVFNGGGAVFMNNDAAIDDNMSAGISMTNLRGLRPTLTMSGHSRISNNQSSQGASAGIIMGGDIVMGVAEGDAPIVTGNRDVAYAVGGWLLQDTTLTMRYGAEISDNHAVQYGGAITAYGGCTISMQDNAVIKNNSSEDFAAGIILATGSTLTMDDNAQIFGNACTGGGGGVHLQSGSILEMKGNASIHDNTAGSGAGVYLLASTASIGADNSSPRIFGNTATALGGGIFVGEGSSVDLTGRTVLSGNTAERGGGIFISEGSDVHLMGQTVLSDNTATEGNGIYKMGELNLSQSPQVLDGLFFDALAGEEFQTSPAYTSNVPVIVGALTDTARIQLESSRYVAPANVPLVIADTGSGYGALEEADRGAWLIPRNFSQGHAVILTDALDQVIIALADYTITYNDLQGAENENPPTYKTADLPITLKDPGRRPGYSFAGWSDVSGRRVTQIPLGSLGNLVFTALWEKLTLSFNGAAQNVCNIPPQMPVEQGEAVIPSTVPCRQGYQFICWNIPASGSGQVYFPGDTIQVSDSSVTLTAQWQPLRCDCPGEAPRPMPPQNCPLPPPPWADPRRCRC